RAEAMDHLIAEEASANYRHKSEAVKSLREFMDVGGRLPDAVIEGELHNSFDFNPTFREAWTNREADPAALEDALRQTARNLDEMASSIQADSDAEDVSGSFPDGLKDVTKDLRGAAQLGSKIPARLVENWLQSAAKEDANVYRVIAEREQDPYAYQDFVSRAA